MDGSRSPLPHAKDALAGYYREHGIMPSVQRLAQLLGVSSTSSAHYIVQKLRDEGYLGTNEFGKLTPGPLFQRGPSRPAVPPELLQELPEGQELKVVRVDETWRAEDLLFLPGDLLILAPPESASDGDLLVLRRGSTRLVSERPRSGWRPEGVLLGQYRAFQTGGQRGGRVAPSRM